jgi:2-dehydropantoate 2-reductase
VASVAVVGVGAIGGYVAAQVAAAGHELVPCSRRPFDQLQVASATGSVTIPTPALTDPAQAAPVDWVLVATKAHQSAAVEPWLARLCDERTRAVVVLQNGVEHEGRVASPSAGTPVVPAVVLCGAESPRPGVVVHHGGSGLDVEAGPLGDELVELFAGSDLVVGLADDLRTAQWRKLLLNAVSWPLTALPARRLGVFREEPAQRVGRQLLAECLAVARAEGALLDEGDVDAILELLAAQPAEMGSSMLYDRLAGRPLEHDAVTGAVVRIGASHGIATPVNGALLALLELASTPDP